MKAVMVSIQPKWCELIASGEKTIEVRKTRPKIEVPFKTYIFCTKYQKEFDDYFCIDAGTEKAKQFFSGGKVIGEFVCDNIYNVTPHYDIPTFCNQYECGWYHGEDDACLSFEELDSYLKGKNGYGWHISDLVIYNKPKELGTFWAYNEELHRRYDVDDEFCCYDETNEYGEALTDCGDACNNILNCYHCWEEWSGWCHRVKRPPQSWCYVEELK